MKRIISLVLTLTVILSVFAGIGTTASAGTNGHTQAEAVQWIRNQEGSTYAGNYGYQCVDLVREYYAYLGQARPTGNANSYLNDSNGHKPSGWTIHYGTSGIQPGDISVWTGGEYGHVALVVSVGSNSCTVMQQNGDGGGYNRTEGSKGHYGTQYFSGITGYIHPDFASPPTPPPTPVPSGEEMSYGYARTIPDGDYIIGSAVGRLFLDIAGTTGPIEDGTKIQLWACPGLWTDTPAYDVWTLKYDGATGFYTIYQKGTTVSLDVTNGSKENNAKMQAYHADGTPAQRFAISRYENGNYKIQAKCSSFCLDVYNGTAESGTIVQQHVPNGSAAQQWYFIPYKPAVSSSDKVASTVYNGHEYVLYKKLMTWNDARDWCNNQGGNLVTITSSGEQSVVETLMAKASNWIWLGATDEASEGTWKWVTDESFSYSNWGGGQPDNAGNEDYLHMYLDGKWNDIPDYDGRCEYFILEKTHNHTSNSGTVILQPTCTQTGVKTYKCTTCGATVKTETIPAKGHTPGNWEVVTPATTSSNGKEVRKCTVCMKKLEERVIPKLNAAVPVSLYLEKKTTKIRYDLNEAFDPTGAVLRVKYQDGTVKSLATADVQLEGFESSISGSQKVYFTYTENGVTVKSTVFTLLVDRQVNAIYIPHKPNKTHYIMGEAFDRTGMQIIATYTDGSKADVTESVRTSGFDSQTFGLKKMTVSYTYKGKTVSLQFSYQMNPKLTGITLTHKPYKLSTYKVGDSLSKAGMVITASFSDGSTKDVTNLIRTSGYSSKQVGKQVITVSYTYGTQTKSVQFSIVMNK